ncbi:MAG: hypothetical protein QOH38_1150, partial [Thermoleophilaceae bacterium]|nr:hypothetical protein [Thermoleophilaceae bacterium]
MRKLTISIIALALAATGLVACGGSSSGGGGSLSLVA